MIFHTASTSPATRADLFAEQNSRSVKGLGHGRGVKATTGTWK